MGPFSPIGKRTYARYIITTTDYLTRWDEAAPIRDYIMVTASEFLFDNIVTRSECPKIFISDQGMHFFNQLIEGLTEEFQIHHIMTMLYHPQANGVVKEFKKILENALKNICNVQRDGYN